MNHTSNRSFGFMWVAIVVGSSLYPLVSGGQIRWWLLCVAIFIGAITIFCSDRLTPINNGWFLFGKKLQSFTSPIMLGLLYFVFITPAAWLFRLCGREQMSLTFDKTAPTYWQNRSGSEDRDCDFTKPF